MAAAALRRWYRDEELCGLAALAEEFVRRAGRQQPSVPLHILDSHVLPYLEVRSVQQPISASCNQTAVIGKGGELSCFGNNTRGQCSPPWDLGPVSAVAADLSHTCAVAADGRLVCFGNENHGRCCVPEDLGPVVAVAAGALHTCAVTAGGRLVCFGDDSCGQCSVPEGLEPIAAVAAGALHTCAIGAGGRLACFGDNSTGQCTVPEGLGPVAAVAADLTHTCAVAADGRLVCFGGNSHGQCSVPDDLGPVVAVAAGLAHTCAIRADGRLVCFGDDSYGQCTVPEGLEPVLAVAAGSYHTCAVAADGRVVCFGLDDHSQCSGPADLGPLETAMTGLAPIAADHLTGRRWEEGEAGGWPWAQRSGPTSSRTACAGRPAHKAVKPSLGDERADDSTSTTAGAEDLLATMPPSPDSAAEPLFGAAPSEAVDYDPPAGAPARFVIEDELFADSPLSARLHGGGAGALAGFCGEGAWREDGVRASCRLLRCPCY